MVSRRNEPADSSPDLGGLTRHTPASWKHLAVYQFGEDVNGDLYMLRFYYSGVLLTKLDLRTMGLPENTSTLCISRDEALRIGYQLEQWLARRDSLPEPKKSRK